MAYVLLIVVVVAWAKREYELRQSMSWDRQSQRRKFEREEFARGMLYAERFEPDNPGRMLLLRSSIAMVKTRDRNAYTDGIETYVRIHDNLTSTLERIKNGK